MIAAALLALAQTMAPPTTPAPPGDAASDARCIVVFGFIGSRAAPDQAEATKRGILYFVGKLRGRDPAVNVATTVTTAADAAKAAGLNARAEAQRCSTELESAGEALRGIRPAGAPTPTPGR